MEKTPEEVEEPWDGITPFFDPTVPLVPDEPYAEPPHKLPPSPRSQAETVYIYRLDRETNLMVIVGKVFIDQNEDAWVRINAQDLAAGIGVENIDGVALLDRNMFNSLEE